MKTTLTQTSTSPIVSFIVGFGSVLSLFSPYFDSNISLKKLDTDETLHESQKIIDSSIEIAIIKPF